MIGLSTTRVGYRSGCRRHTSLPFDGPRLITLQLNGLLHQEIASSIRTIIHTISRYGNVVASLIGQFIFAILIGKSLTADLCGISEIPIIVRFVGLVRLFRCSCVGQVICFTGFTHRNLQLHAFGNLRSIGNITIVGDSIGHGARTVRQHHGHSGAVSTDRQRLDHQLCSSFFSGVIRPNINQVILNVDGSVLRILGRAIKTDQLKASRLIGVFPRSCQIFARIGTNLVIPSLTIVNVAAIGGKIALICATAPTVRNVRRNDQVGKLVCQRLLGCTNATVFTGIRNTAIQLSASLHRDDTANRAMTQSLNIGVMDSRIGIIILAQGGIGAVISRVIRAGIGFTLHPDIAAINDRIAILGQISPTGFDSFDSLLCISRCGIGPLGNALTAVAKVDDHRGNLSLFIQRLGKRRMKSHTRGFFVSAVFFVHIDQCIVLPQESSALVGAVHGASSAVSSRHCTGTAIGVGLPVDQNKIDSFLGRFQTARGWFDRSHAYREQTDCHGKRKNER